MVDLLRSAGRTALALATAAAWVSSASNVAAQQNRDATASAVDAFGETVGAEEIGLYNTSVIRGFNPQNSGALRIDGFFFARAGGVASGAVDRRSVNVGVNAAPLNYPSPSGIVNIHLKTFSPGDRILELSLNSLGWFSPTLDANFSVANSKGDFGAAGGFQLEPHLIAPDGSLTHEYYVGVVPGWRISDSVRLHALLSYGHANYDRGFWGNVLSGATLPPTQSTNVLLPPRAAAGKEYAATGGLFLDGSFDGGWRVGASVIYSANGLFTDFTSFDYDASALVHATLVNIPEQTTRAFTLETRASKDFRWLGADHQATVAFRYRNSEAINSDTTSFDLGIVDARHPVYPSVPDFVDNGLRSSDIVNQEVVSFDYGGVYWGSVQLRAGVDLTRHGERFDPLSGVGASDKRQDFAFPHASIIYSPFKHTALFASYSRGLEDSGVAPSFAVNGNEVLPAALAKATELGFRQAVSPSLTLIVAGFVVQKPTPGLQAGGVFSLVGEERHRGMEMSLTGQLAPLTRIVLGAVAMDQSLSGPLVSSGEVGSHPVGTAPKVAAGNIVQTLPFARTWSVDAQFRLNDRKYIDTANLARTKAFFVLNIGARHEFHIGRSSAELRLVATNVLDTKGWNVDTSGAILPVTRPTIWGTLTTRFGVR